MYIHDNEKLNRIKKKHGPLGVFFLILAGIAFAAFFAFLFGGIVKQLWNYTITDIFNTTPITYLQAVAMIVLCRLLFGKFGPPDHVKGHVRHKMRRKFCTDYKDYWEEDGKKAIDKLVDDTISKDELS